MKGSLRQRSPGSWELKFDLGTHPVTGRRQTKFKTLRGSKKEAEKELRRILTQVDSDAFADPGKITVSEFLDGWLKAHKAEVSTRTHERYKEMVDNHIKPRIGAMMLAKLRPFHLEGFYADLLESGRLDGKGGLSPQTIKHMDRLLHTAFVSARRQGLIVLNPVDDVMHKPKVVRKEVDVLKPEGMGKLLQAAENTRLYVPIYIALGTGLRRGEVLALRWKDIDLEAGSLMVRKAVEQTKEGLRLKEPKTKRSQRQVDLPASLVTVLRDYHVKQMEERLALGLGRDTEGLVFTKLDGGLINPRAFSKEVSRLVKKADVGSMTFHGLRHSHLTQLLQDGIHPKVAQERAGHASIAVTMDIYSHALPSLQEEAALKIDAALNAGKEAI